MKCVGEVSRSKYKHLFAVDERKNEPKCHQVEVLVVGTTHHRTSDYFIYNRLHVNSIQFPEDIVDCAWDAGAEIKLNNCFIRAKMNFGFSVCFKLC